MLVFSSFATVNVLKYSRSLANKRPFSRSNMCFTTPVKVRVPTQPTTAHAQTRYGRIFTKYVECIGKILRAKIQLPGINVKFVSAQQNTDEFEDPFYGEAVIEHFALFEPSAAPSVRAFDGIFAANELAIDARESITGAWRTTSFLCVQFMPDPPEDGELVQLRVKIIPVGVIV